MEKFVRKTIVALLSLLALVSVVQGVRNASTYSQDFQWDAAMALRAGINPYDESINPTGALQQGKLGEFYTYFESIDAPQKMEANQFPSLLMILFPYTLLSPNTARIVFLITNLIFTGMICILLKMTFLKECDTYLYIVLMLLMLCGTPYRNQLGVGQHTLLSFAFFLLAVYLVQCKEQNTRTVVGVVISLFICLFKYTLTAPLFLWFVYKKKYKEIIIPVLMHGILTCAAALMLKDSLINMILKPLKVASALSSEGGLDLGALFGGSPFAFILAGIIAIVLFIITLTAGDDNGDMIFAVALLWSLILTYHRTYDFFVLPAAYCIFTAGAFTSEKIMRSARIGYAVMLIGVFFILRIFSESMASRAVIGAIYYAFTIFATVVLVLRIKERRDLINNECRSS